MIYNNDDEDNNIELNKQILINDVIAVKSNVCKLINQAICCIMDHVTAIQNQTKIEHLGQFIAHTCFEQKSLTNIDHQINSLDDNEENSLKKFFLKNF